jgi:hypothetical protein
MAVPRFRAALGLMSVLFLSSMALPLTAQEAILKALSPEQYRLLQAGEYVIVSDSKKNPLLLDLVPAGRLEPATLPKGAQALDRVECLWAVKTEVAPDKVFARMHQISKMAGMQYYSRTRKAMHLLIESASLVDAASPDKLIPDPAPSALMDFNRFTFIQKDTKFGSNRYELISERVEDRVAMAVTNQTDMKIALVPVLKRGNLVTIFVMMKTSEGYLTYSGAFFDSGFSFALSSDIKESLVNRLRALSQWIFQ